MSRMNHVNTKDEVIEAFRVFDKTGSGSISAAEFRTILSDLGEFMDPAEIEDLIYEADTQGNGNIDYASFAEQLFAWD